MKICLAPPYLSAHPDFCRARVRSVDSQIKFFMFAVFDAFFGIRVTFFDFPRLINFLLGKKKKIFPLFL